MRISGPWAVLSVTTEADVAAPGFDFCSRSYAPAVGVDEDPVCGSAHCFLGPHWAARLGKTELTAEAASPRGGVVSVSVSPERVALQGKAITTLNGPVETFHPLRAFLRTRFQKR